MGLKVDIRSQLVERFRVDQWTQVVDLILQISVEKVCDWMNLTYFDSSLQSVVGDGGDLLRSIITQECITPLW
jgi:hypothetical protein